MGPFDYIFQNPVLTLVALPIIPILLLFNMMPQQSSPQVGALESKQGFHNSESWDVQYDSSNNIISIAVHRDVNENE